MLPETLFAQNYNTENFMKVSIQEIEYYLPEKIDNLQIMKKEHPDWDTDSIYSKSGIDNRHISSKNESVVDMAIRAIDKLSITERIKDDIDLLILITQTPDYVLPTSACIIQHRLGLRTSTAAFDINLGCSGFIYGLSVAGSLITSGVANKGLLICSENYTKNIDKSDRICRPIFSDGAAAVMLSSCGDSDALGPFEFGTDGEGFKDLIVSTESIPDISDLKPGRLFMNGSKVFMFSMDAVPKCVNNLLKKAGMHAVDIDLFVFHQASKLVIDNIIRKLQLSEEKVFMNCSRIGNTVSASIPIALKDAAKEKRLKFGDQVMLVGFGVGYSWGSCLIQWGVSE